MHSRTWKKYFVVGTNDNALHDTMNGSVVGELVRCKDCIYKNEYGYCTFYTNFHHLTADIDYCSDAERKEE